MRIACSCCLFTISQQHLDSYYKFINIYAMQYRRPCAYSPRVDLAEARLDPMPEFSNSKTFAAWRSRSIEIIYREIVYQLLEVLYLYLIYNINYKLNINYKCLVKELVFYLKHGGLVHNQNNACRISNTCL